MPQPKTDMSVVLSPIGYFLQWAGFDPAPPRLRIASLRNQPRALRHPEVLRHRGHAHVEGLGEFGDRAFARSQTGQDGAARAPALVKTKIPKPGDPV